MSEQFSESFDSRGATLAVEREAGVIRGVKLLGPSSSNGRDYPKETMARAVGLYEGAKVNVDHPEGSAATPRRYGDRLGALKNVRVGRGSDGLFGDLHFNPKHALAEQLIWDAEHAPENVGLSHNIKGKTTRGRNGRVVVEEIQRVNSVDLVADPATTRGLFEDHGDQESQEEKDQMEFQKITVEQLRAERPDLLESIAADAVKTHLGSEEAKAKDAKLTALIEEVDRYKGKEELAAKQEAVDKLITEAKLPKELASDVLRESLLATDDEGRKRLIEERQAIAKGLGSTGPKSTEQKTLMEGVAGELPSAKEYAARLRRAR